VDPNDEMTATRIVSNLIYCLARYAAHLSQAFTATDAVKVDVEKVIRKYQFTDGVGTLSKELSGNIWAQLKRAKRRQLPKEVPPAYQIRFMGSKGMISVDHTLTGCTICLRPSMVKFLTEEAVNDIEIARAFDKPGPYFLNRPLIMLLEGLGVPFEVFMKFQDEAVQTTRKAASSLKEAASLLECHGLGTSYRLPWILNHLEKLSLNSIPDDDFYKKMLEYATHHVLRDLKNHSRILPFPS
jgi:RNA-dependent RNA polymerase